jgi:carbon monoxide dehydrogenase subunit G
MTITVNVELGYEFDVKASAKEVFDLLSNVPESASHYPQVEALTDLGGGTYRWTMEKIGIASIHLQTVYVSKYVANRAKGSVIWTPVAGEGNTLVSGNWKITAGRKSTNVVLHVNGDVALPLPALMKLVAQPLVEAEFEKLTEKYIDNLTQCFGGEI